MITSTWTESHRSSHGQKQQGRRAAVLPGFFTVEEGLRGQGGRRRDEHGGQHLLRAGRR